MNTPTGAQANRRVFLSRTLTKDVRLSGTATADLVAVARRARRRTSASSIADYGAGTQVTRGGEGISNTTHAHLLGRHRQRRAHRRRPARPAPIGDTCTRVGRARSTRRATSRSPSPRTNVTQWRVTRGIRDSSNRDSLWFADATPVTIGQKYHFKFPTMPTEHIFKAGHQIGDHRRRLEHEHGVRHRQRQRRRHARHQAVEGHAADPGRLRRAGRRPAGTDAETVAPVLRRRAGRHRGRDDRRRRARRSPSRRRPRPTTRTRTRPSPATPASGSKFTVGTPRSSPARRRTPTATLGGEDVQRRRRRDVPVNDVGGTVPATLSLTLGAPAQFGAFTPGVTRTYLASHDRHRDLDRR